MAKLVEKPSQRDTIRAARVIKCAEIAGVCVRQVRRVMDGDSENNLVEAVFMQIVEGENELIQKIKHQVINPHS